jgi:hypothetical protein
MQDHDEGNGTHWVVFYYNKPNFNIFWLVWFRGTVTSRK